MTVFLRMSGEKGCVFFPSIDHPVVRGVEDQRDVQPPDDRLELLLLGGLRDDGAVRIVDLGEEEGGDPVPDGVAELQDRVGIGDAPLLVDERHRKEHPAVHVDDQVVVLPGPLVDDVELLLLRQEDRDGRSERPRAPRGDRDELRKALLRVLRDVGAARLRLVVEAFEDQGAQVVVDRVPKDELLQLRVAVRGRVADPPFVQDLAGRLLEAFPVAGGESPGAQTSPVSRPDEVGVLRREGPGSPRR